MTNKPTSSKKIFERLLKGIVIGVMLAIMTIIFGGFLYVSFLAGQCGCG